MNNKIFLSVIPLTAILLVGGFALQDKNEEVLIHNVSLSMVDIPFEAYKDAAQFAIVGKVIEKSSAVYTDPKIAELKRLAISTGDDSIFYDRTILTDVTIQVEEDLFGKYTNQTIIVRVPGGSIPGYTTIYDSAPTFTIGERITIFVGNGQSYLISPDHYVVLGLSQGTIKMNDIANSKFANSTTTEQQIKDKIKSLKTAEF